MGIIEVWLATNNTTSGPKNGAYTINGRTFRENL